MMKSENCFCSLVLMEICFCLDACENFSLVLYLKIWPICASVWVLSLILPGAHCALCSLPTQTFIYFQEIFLSCHWLLFCSGCLMSSPETLLLLSWDAHSLFSITVFCSLSGISLSNLLFWENLSNIFFVHFNKAPNKIIVHWLSARLGHKDYSGGPI